jgi:hypothetical protein
MASWILSKKVWLAVSIDFILCFWQNTICLFTKGSINLLYVNFSKILEKTGKIDIGLL